MYTHVYMCVHMYACICMYTHYIYTYVPTTPPHLLPTHPSSGGRWISYTNVCQDVCMYEGMGVCASPHPTQPIPTTPSHPTS